GGARHNLARTWCGNGAAPADLEQALRELDLAIAEQRRIRAKAPDYERARAFLMLHLRLRGNCLARLARREQLVAVAEELATDVTNATHLRADARFWLRAAEMLEPEPAEANAALRARYEMAALGALLAAERAGWDSNSRLSEAVYRPLEALPGFRELRRRIEAKLDKSPPK
ncbi:MAG TPA: hypothetical protein VFZ65_07680, partial [Planctomycetota bacterium]|nr:hypothetical protein [Planctomycetota bacterium]